MLYLFKFDRWCDDMAKPYYPVNAKASMNIPRLGFVYMKVKRACKFEGKTYLPNTIYVYGRYLNQDIFHVDWV